MSESGSKLLSGYLQGVGLGMIWMYVSHFDTLPDVAPQLSLAVGGLLLIGGVWAERVGGGES